MLSPCRAKVGEVRNGSHDSESRGVVLPVSRVRLEKDQSESTGQEVYDLGPDDAHLKSKVWSEPMPC